MTDNGNFVVDVDFGLVAADGVSALNDRLQSIVGVVETGLFVRMATQAYFGQPDGSVVSRVCIY